MNIYDDEGAAGSGSLPFLQGDLTMRRNTIQVADAISWLRQLPDNSVHCCVTSPPYFGLRDYGGKGLVWDAVTFQPNPFYDFEITIPGQVASLGLESTQQAYIGHLVAIFREVRRVLRDDGVCWLNIGDMYSDGNHEPSPMHTSDNVGNVSRRGIAGLPTKNLLQIPSQLAHALQADGWYVRDDVIWHKPSPMPESVKDRCTKSYEHVYMLTKNAKYWSDMVAVRENGSENSHGGGVVGIHRKDAKLGRFQTGLMEAKITGHRNLRNVWTIATLPLSAAHFATMPPKLAKRGILIGCPETCCSECGAGYVRSISREISDSPDWLPACTCNTAETQPGVVIDPFGGAGTTAVAAINLGRDYALCEPNIEYVGIAQRRIQEFRRMLGNADPLQATVFENGVKQLSLFEESVDG